MRTAFSLGQAAEIFLRTRTELADQLVRISATCPPPPFSTQQVRCLARGARDER